MFLEKCKEKGFSTIGSSKALLFRYFNFPHNYHISDHCVSKINK